MTPTCSIKKEKAWATASETKIFSVLSWQVLWHIKSRISSGSHWTEANSGAAHQKQQSGLWLWAQAAISLCVTKYHRHHN